MTSQLQQGFGITRNVGFLRKFVRDDSGATAVIAALVLPVLVMGMGLGAETGYQFMTQRKLQHAADLAAHAGAVQLRSGGTESAIVASAVNIATQGGFVEEDGSIDVHWAPVSGPNTGNMAAVEVILTKEQRRFFSAVLIEGSVLIAARAVALIEHQDPVACVLGMSNVGDSVKITGSTQLDLLSCDLHSNSSFSMKSGDLSARCVSAVGNLEYSAGLHVDCAAPREMVAPILDPYGNVLEPHLPPGATCERSRQGRPNRLTPLTPGPGGVMYFCNGLNLQGDIKLGPGVYYISGGDLTTAGGVSIVGSDVTIYFSGSARSRLTGNVDLNLSAPSAGEYAGILFFGDPESVGSVHQFTGTPDSRMQGAIYTPSADIVFSGNFAGNDSDDNCIQVIGWTVTFTGNSSLAVDCSGSGVNDIYTEFLVTIVE